MPQRTLAAATLAGQIMSKGTDFTAATAFHFAGAVGAWVQLTLRRIFSWTTAIRGWWRFMDRSDSGSSPD